MLSDPVDSCGAAYGLASARLWRFVDVGRRLDFLLAGFGWCRMPEHLFAKPLTEAKLVPLRIADDPTPREGLTIYAAPSATVRSLTWPSTVSSMAATW